VSDDATKQLAALGKAAGLKLVGDDDGQPVVKIELDLNATAARLGEIVGRLDLFSMNGEQVFFDYAGEMQVMTGRKFRTWITNHVLTCRKFITGTNVPISESLQVDEAATILECENFRRGVRPLKGVNHVRLPMLRMGRELEKLPWGYDDEAQIYTVPGGVDYETDMDIAAAKAWLVRLFGMFPFTDERSLGVQVAALLALFVKHLPGGGGLRPGFLWLANEPESGKSVLAKASLFPVLGRAASAKMKKNEDLDKELEAFCRAAVPFIFLDNVYGGIESASIDQLLTSEESTGRAMGGHGIFTAKNTALLLVTGNRLELNEDAARRFLVVDLFEKGNPAARKVDPDMILTDGIMRSPAWRARMLSICWAFVAHWHEKGMEKGSVVLGSFEDYSKVLGGIVEAAGYFPPFTRAKIPDAISPEKQDFQEFLKLVLEEMGERTEVNFTLEDFARIARAGQLYQKQVGTQAEGRKQTIKDDGLGREERGMAQDHGYMTPAQRSSFGKLIPKLLGKEAQVDGRQLEFGKRAQARKSAYTVTVL